MNEIFKVATEVWKSTPKWLRIGLLAFYIGMAMFGVLAILAMAKYIIS
jgi:hypothetical protein